MRIIIAYYQLLTTTSLLQKKRYKSLAAQAILKFSDSERKKYTRAAAYLESKFGIKVDKLTLKNNHVAILFDFVDDIVSDDETETTMWLNEEVNLFFIEEYYHICW